MSHILPTAPPLPLKPLFNSNRNYTLRLSPKKSKIEIDECLWALQFPELQKCCFLERVCIRLPPRTCKYYNIPGLLQDGPTCGLVALSMLLNGIPSPKELLAIAKELNYTNNGEMFSAQYLLNLTSDKINSANLAGKLSNGSCEIFKGQLNCPAIKELLLAGACVLVPYDPDFKHAPCNKNGHKAHWALILGYLISDEDEFYVLARHGKAINLAVWSLNALSKSNANLNEFAQPQGYPDCDFVLPPGGISGDLGLKERAIIIKGITHEIICIK